jgi:hypothetical protein
VEGDPDCGDGEGRADKHDSNADHHSRVVLTGEPPNQWYEEHGASIIRSGR